MPPAAPHLNLAWISTFAPGQRRGGWPAAHAHLHRALQAEVMNLVDCAPLHAADDALARWCSRARSALTGRRSLWPYSRRRLDAFAADFTRRLPAPPPHAALFFGVAEFLRIFPAIPSACYTDSAFVPFLETYHAQRRYRASELKRLADLEAAWLGHQRLIFTSSDHAARQIVARYRVPPARVIPVGIGANLDSPPPPPAAGAAPAPGYSVVFICTDFKRKGGAAALAAVAHARTRLPQLTLDLIGDYPADAARAPFVRAHGWIDKDTPAGAARFGELMRTGSLFLLLSREDLTPTAICEASAFALPALATAVGGIPEMIQDNTSGWLVPADATPATVGDRIASALSDPARRTACGLAARRAFDARWNWHAVARRIALELAAAIRSPAA